MVGLAVSNDLLVWRDPQCLEYLPQFDLRLQAQVALPIYGQDPVHIKGTRDMTPACGAPVATNELRRASRVEDNDVGVVHMSKDVILVRDHISVMVDLVVAMGRLADVVLRPVPFVQPCV